MITDDIELCAFLSYRSEDLPARNEFQAHNLAGVACRFVEIPVADAPVDWRGLYRDMLADVDGVVVLVGPGTAQSEPVRWEIGEAARCGKRVVGVRIHNGPHQIPDSLSDWPVLDWDQDQIRKELESW